MANSFIENINNLANASKLAVADIVEDTKTARDESVAAVGEVEVAQISIGIDRELAKSYATKGYGVPVTGTVGVDATYSALHWAEKAAQLVGNPIVDDGIISENYSWSSTKVNSILTDKAHVAHTHGTTYEPIILKNTAFNKHFPTASSINGTTSLVARADHTHALVYEPVIGTKGSAFNKSFGTLATDVASGSHNHDTLYMPKVIENSAYNKSFVLNSAAPLSTEVARGNHTHNSNAIIYNNSGTTLISSGTVQGAIDQLEANVANVSQEEKSKLVAGLTDTSYIITINSAGVPVVINAGTTLDTDSKNSVYNNGVQIKYPDLSIPSKLIEGQWSATVTIEALANKLYYLIPTINNVPLSNAYKVEIGSTSNPYSGPLNATVGGWLSGLTQGDVIGVGIANTTDTTNITLNSMSVSWAGQPEGALVASGTTVTHNEVLGRDAGAQHPTSSIYETGNTLVTLDTLLNGKVNKATTSVLNNVVTFDAEGHVKDSGVSINTVNNHMLLLSAHTTGNLLVVNSDGQATDSGKNFTNLANISGSTTQVFSVGDALTTENAVNKGQLEVVAAIASGAIPNVANPIVGNFPQIDSSGNLVNSDYTGSSFVSSDKEYSSTEIGRTATTNLEATTVEDALVELQLEIDSTAVNSSASKAVTDKINVSSVTQITFNSDGTMTVDI